MTTVLFWDIDGTLLTTGRAGVFALEDAVREVCGIQTDLSTLVTSGLTDSEVAELSISTALGRDPEHGELDAFLDVYGRQLPGRLSMRNGSVLPGVFAALEAVADRGDVLSLLLTGNTEAGARAKLRHYGLDGHIDDGAFCRPGDAREDIAARAAAMASERAAQGDIGALVVIGDTPHDLRAARAIGAHAVLVATGSHGLEELAGLEPWRALPQLPPAHAFLELVDSIPARAPAR